MMNSAEVDRESTQLPLLGLQTSAESSRANQMVEAESTVSVTDFTRQEQCVDRWVKSRFELGPTPCEDRLPSDVKQFDPPANIGRV